VRVDNKGEKKIPPYKPRKISLLKKFPSLTHPAKRLFGREPGHSLPQEVGEKEKAKTWMPDKSAQA